MVLPSVTFTRLIAKLDSMPQKTPDMAEFSKDKRMTTRTPSL
jgi:hypothetical protein